MTPLLLILLLAGVPGGVSQEDWDETLAALSSAEAAASIQDLADLAGQGVALDNALGWERRWRQDRDTYDLVRLDLLAGPAKARVRMRSGSTRKREVAGALGVAAEAVELTAGWWSWRAGFGLLVGAAGRPPGITADGSVLPATSGPRAWTGSADERARRGGVVDLRWGGWRLGGAIGIPADGGEDGVAVAAAGRRNGTLMVTAVSAAGEVAGVSAAGRWKTAAWRGAWETVWRSTTGAMAPAGIAGALDWRPGHQVSLGATCVMSSGPSASPLAAGHELTGRRGGDGWAVRGAWRAAPQVRFLALISGRRRRGDEPGHERRRVLELQVRCRPRVGLEARVRYRGAVTDGPVWDPDWPWEAPRDGPVQRRQTLGLAVVGTAGESSFRADLRTLSLSGDRSVGRRSLLGLEARHGAAGGLVLRTGWHEAWGDPVDLVSAISPLPGRLVPRHWGSWRGEAWVGMACDGRRGGIACACHLRRPSTPGPGTLEVRARLRLRW
ncbi:MAG: hypothetical protein GY838_05810 [bacterium]|nr:hypothetical protein [bacterium]